jgi:hypothetical protein
MTKPTVTRFIEAFVAVFIVAFAGSAVFSDGTDLLGADGLKAIVEAAIAAALLAARRALAVQ